MTREEDETLLAISRVVQEAGGECDGDEYPKDVLRGVSALIESLNEELAKAKKQAEGLCDGCGELLDDAYCTKCLNRPAPSSPSEAARQAVIEAAINYAGFWRKEIAGTGRGIALIDAVDALASSQSKPGEPKP